jgi:hypothetical protein
MSPLFPEELLPHLFSMSASKISLTSARRQRRASTRAPIAASLPPQKTLNYSPDDHKKISHSPCPAPSPGHPELRSIMERNASEPPPRRAVSPCSSRKARGKGSCGLTSRGGPSSALGSGSPRSCRDDYCSVVRESGSARRSAPVILAETCSAQGWAPASRNTASISMKRTRLLSNWSNPSVSRLRTIREIDSGRAPTSEANSSRWIGRSTK